MIDASYTPESMEAYIVPMLRAPVPQATPLPVEQCPAVMIQRWLLVWRPVKPTEHQGVLELVCHSTAPDRTV